MAKTERREATAKLMDKRTPGSLLTKFARKKAMKSTICAKKIGGVRARIMEETIVNPIGSVIEIRSATIQTIFMNACSRSPKLFHE
jgi:hypothetical protein